MVRFFGTDGVRGIANDELTCDKAFVLGELAVALLGPRLIVGRDTRLSGSMLESALAAGVSSRGGTALLAGIIPTPAVALLTRDFKADGGIVISASHNPPEYNGIKFFDSEGFKLTKELEDKFEEGLQQYVKAHPSPMLEFSTNSNPAPKKNRPTGPAVGMVLPFDERVQVDSAIDHYVEHAIGTVRKQGLDLSGLLVAVDVGHGASCVTTPLALTRLGAKVVSINTDFNGCDINVDCGSTHLDPLKALVAESGADLGIAHDGDADRMLAVDANGTELDGDVIEAIVAIDLKARGLLPHDTVVSTVMCNLGFVKAMEGQGIEVVQTDVGDSNVLAAMLEGAYTIGGEQSGHMILLEHNSTGDGLISALQLLAVMKRSAKSLTELSRVMTRFPQALLNVRVTNKDGFTSSVAIKEAIAAANRRLGDKGRTLLRPSGTESLVRVMVEAHDEQLAKDEAAILAAVVESELC